MSTNDNINNQPLSAEGQKEGPVENLSSQGSNKQSESNLKSGPWIFTVDNIFVDVARDFPDNTFLIENGVKPGSQNTAIDDELKNVALSILNMPDGEYGSKKISATVGGCAMNTSRAANMMIKTNAEQAEEQRVLTLGSIGKDASSNFVLQQLASEGIKYKIHQDQEAITGQCAVTVVKADRTCIAVLDACEKYPSDHMKSVLATEEIKSCEFFYSTGFFIQSNYEALKMMAQYSLSNQKLFAFNFAAEQIYLKCQDQILEMMRYADFIFCNKEEALAAAKNLHSQLNIDKNEQDLMKIAVSISSYEKLDTSRPRVAVITDSDQPCTVAMVDQLTKQEISFKIDVQSLPEEKVIDSNGAGDSFTGGFIAKLCLIMHEKAALGESKISTFTQEQLSEATRWGCIVAGEVVQRYGCTFPQVDELQRLIQCQEKKQK